MEDEDIFLSDIQKLSDRKVRAESKLYNCLPLPFENARKRFPGFERGSYIIISANQKVGKSKLTDYLFVYESLNAVIQKKKIKPHVIYFSLEENPFSKRLALYEHLFYTIDGNLIDNKVLKSTDNDYPCPQWVLDKLKSPIYKQHIDEYFDMVEFPLDNKTKQCVSLADDIFNICLKYAEKHGHYNTYKKSVWNEQYKCYLEEDVISESDPFTWNDEEEIPIVIIDNFANLKVPNGSTKYNEIEKMSKYCITLKNLGFIVVGVQHQSQEKESLVRRQSNDVVPSAEGLADNKSTSKDLTLLVGLMSPFKYEMTNYMGYDIKMWKDNIRFLYIKEDRENGAVNLCQPLLFIGEASYFKELPEYTNTEELNKIYDELMAKKQDYERNFHQKDSMLFLAFAKFDRTLHRNYGKNLSNTRSERVG